MAKKPSVVTEKQTKSQILSTLAEDTGLTKKEIAAVLDSLAGLAQAHLKKRGSGEFTVPSLGVKLRRVIKPARKARKGKKTNEARRIYQPSKGVPSSDWK